jgi:hypothetical protein
MNFGNRLARHPMLVAGLNKCYCKYCMTSGRGVVHVCAGRCTQVVTLDHTLLEENGWCQNGWHSVLSVTYLYFHKISDRML